MVFSTAGYLLIRQGNLLLQTEILNLSQKSRFVFFFFLLSSGLSPQIVAWGGDSAS